MASILNPASRSDAPARDELPRLVSGDRITRAEFHRRYEARPDIQKAELIEGVVHVAAAARFGLHGRQDNALNGVLFLYAAATPGVEGGGNTTTILDDGNEIQPDSLLRIETAAGGRSTVNDQNWLLGGPELVGEVAAGRIRYDATTKLEVYRRHGVCEYLLWRTGENMIQWFVLRGGQFETLAPDSAGVIRSEVFPGLWVDVPALLRNDFAAVVKVLTEGLASAEHTAFAAKLKARLDAAQ
jgi:hypothetical protein